MRTATIALGLERCFADVGPVWQLRFYLFAELNLPDTYCATLGLAQSST
jgi:hypothetical protein